MGSSRQRTRVETGIYHRLALNGKNELVEHWEVCVPNPDKPGKSIWRRVPDVEGPTGIRRVRAYRAQLLANGASAPARGADRPKTVGEMCDSYLLAKKQTCSKSTYADYTRHARDHIRPTLGDKPITAVTVDDLLTWIADQDTKSSSAWTIRARWNVLRGVLGLAKRRGLIGTNPADQLDRGERPTPGGRSMRILDTTEIGQLLAHTASDRDRLFCALAIFTGLRLGELLALTWADVDTKARVLHVRTSINARGERVPPKTAAGVRDVVLMNRLEKQLRDHRMASPHKLPEHPVFASRKGTPLDRGIARRAFTNAAKAAGLEGLRLHDARHTFASILITHPRLGEDVVFVSGQLGHKRVSTTLDIYAKLFDQRDHADRVRDGLDDAFGGML